MLFFVELFIDFAVLSVLYTCKRNNTDKLEQQLCNLPRHPAALQTTIIFHVYVQTCVLAKFMRQKVPLK